MNRGILYVVLAYALWGVLPVYWKSIKTVPPSEILCHRITWSLVFLVLILSFRNHWKWIRSVYTNKLILLTYVGTSMILSLNWFTYIWAVNSGYIVESSLGYFINPLISVVLGVIFLHERLRIGQWTAVVIAAAGVIYLTFNYGAFPWIAMILAITFGFYGLLRKVVSFSAIEGLSMEMSIMFIPALIYLLYLEKTGSGSFGHIVLTKDLLLLFAGVATMLPLLLFVKGTRKIDLSTVGILQYIAPTLQFLIGVFVYCENFNKTRLYGFVIIWLALIIYTLESIIMNRKKPILIKPL
ncbi:MAG: transporter [Candidatus Schekmanbacteria bacterium RBG_13_48_7]|uniref:Transporter n=1 Tax=Candidatus Schekmanbacteria bacterium RBG_13_48_7 TaxID=1817878 RepID=A0A1F7RJI4_9BACT|nr:MAG: transporter [Candidatus Schekmanbacteria bacterium RBG_13_48_7]